MILVMLALMVACKPGIPSEYISPGKMEDILVDYHMAIALVQQRYYNEDQTCDTELYLEAVLDRYGVTKEEFDSSLTYYYTRADRFEPIYRNVSERLEEQALVLGASEGDIGKYAMLNAEGDTANIWADRSNMLLLPTPPYNRWDFELEVDTSYHSGDSFLLQFMSEYLYQDGTRQCVAYIAINYADTIISRSLRFQSDGINQMRIPAHDADIKSIKGFFYADGGAERSTTMRMMFLSNVQLIRFHKKEEKHEERIQTDSLSHDTIPRRLMPEPDGDGDRIGEIDPILPVDRGMAEHRVAPRRSVPDERR